MNNYSFRLSKNFIIEEYLNDNLHNTWSVKYLCSKHRKGHSFNRCKKWLKENYPEYFL